MIHVSLVSPPDFQRTIRSRDVRELCIQAENAMRVWPPGGRRLVVTVDGGTSSEREHICAYLNGVRAELEAVPVPARPRR